MTVRGSCSCYGHADECVAAREEDKNVEGMVHGTCLCMHNTKGNNCEYCMDSYNDAPWMPAIGKTKNECKSIKIILKMQLLLSSYFLPVHKTQ